MASILQTNGHSSQGGSRGADGVMEGVRTRQFGALLEKELERRGHTVRNIGEYGSGWTVTNRNGYTYAVSIHFNAYNKKATGSEVYYKNANDKARAALVSANMAKAMGISNRGAKQNSTFYMLNIGFDMLIEICFHDNASDLAKYKANINAVVTAVADGIVGKSSSLEPTKPTVDPFPGVTDEQLAARVWDGEFGNGDEREAALGIRYSAVQALVNEGIGKEGTTPEPAPIPKDTIEVGDTVVINNGAKDYDGTSMMSFVYGRKNRVIEVFEDRVVVTYNGIVVGAFKATDLSEV